MQVTTVKNMIIQLILYLMLSTNVKGINQLLLVRRTSCISLHQPSISVSSIDLLAIEQGDNNDIVDLSQAYKQSDERNAINAQCENIVANLNGEEDVGYKIQPVKAKYVTNPFWQVII